jgi:hypothetical protein
MTLNWGYLAGVALFGFVLMAAVGCEDDESPVLQGLVFPVGNKHHFCVR